MTPQKVKEPYRIGIIGGMGPRADVLLRELIIAETPADKDQDHLEVLCFTNPNIPDRTASLRENNGRAFVAEVIKGTAVLTQAGATILVMPCNTAHSRYADICKASLVPIVDMVALASQTAIKNMAKGESIGLLATDGTIGAGVYQEKIGTDLILPSPENQKKVMDIIYGIKAKAAIKKSAKNLEPIINELSGRGATRIIIGCTELSLCFPYLGKYSCFDPLRIVAKHLVQQGLRTVA